MKPKIHTTALEGNSILMILKYPPNLNHNAPNAQRNLTPADVLNSCNEKKPLCGFTLCWDPVSPPHPNN